MRGDEAMKTTAKTKILFPLILSLVIVILVITDQGNAQTVHGRVFRQTPSGSYPVPYVRLTLFAQGRGRSAPVYSASDGNYYFHNIPPGEYILEVWVDANRSMNFSLRVLSQPQTDIGPIYIP